jgi:peptidoglycan/LPS O-acetylase OafA/YrhL
MLFFVSGYILISEERFTQAIRRDWLLNLILGIVCTLFFFSSAAGVPVFEWLAAPGTVGFYLFWIIFSFNSWCWSMFMIYIGMRYLDYTNQGLRYSREASYPFFLIHQPVIIIIAFYAVQWEVNLLIKLIVVLVGSLVISLGLYELFIRRINPVRALLGMKSFKS